MANLTQKPPIPDIETVSFNEKGEIIENSIFKKVFLPLAIVLVLTLSFGLGRLSKSSKSENINIGFDNTYASTSAPTPPSKTSESSAVPTPSTVNSIQVVGSIKGTKYHYLYCPGAKQISEANKIVFQNAASAEAAGYTLALNCKPR